MTLDDHKVHQKKEKHREGFALDYVWPLLGMVGNAGTPPKKMFQKLSFFWDFGFSSVILVNKPLKALCLSFKMVYQYPLYLLSLCTC